MQRRAKIPTFAKFAFSPALPLPESVLLDLQLSPSCHPCRAGFATRPGFHRSIQLDLLIVFRLAAAIAPRRRKKSARRQFSPLGKAIHHPGAAGARPPAVRTTAQPYTAGRPTPQLHFCPQSKQIIWLPRLSFWQILSTALFREIHRLRPGRSCGIQSRACGANGRNSVPFVRSTPLPCVCGGFSRSR